MKNEISPSGDMVVLTQGEYSDYSFLGHYRANETLVWKSQLEAYLQEHPEQREPYSADQEAFINWLINKKLLTKIEVQEVHLGSYSSWDR